MEDNDPAPARTEPSTEVKAVDFRTEIARAMVVTGLALALIGGLWLVARGAPSAGRDPAFVSATATMTIRERFGLKVFPTAASGVRRIEPIGSPTIPMSPIGPGGG